MCVWGGRGRRYSHTSWIRRPVLGAHLSSGARAPPFAPPFAPPTPSSSVFISCRKCFEAGRDDITTREPMRRRSAPSGEEQCFRLPYCVTRGEGILLSAFVQVRGNKREWLRASPRTHSPRRKIEVTRKSPFGDISVVTLIRTDTTLDHSQKAEKVYLAATSLRGNRIWSMLRL